MAEDMEKRVAQYVQVRDYIKKMDDEHEAKMKPSKDMLQKLAGIIHRFLEDNKLENLRTTAGSCYISTRWTATVQDADVFFKFVIDNEEFDLLERRASATAVRAYVDEHKSLPAGVNLNAIASVGVRRPSEAKS